MISPIQSLKVRNKTEGHWGKWINNPTKQKEKVNLRKKGLAYKRQKRDLNELI